MLCKELPPALTFHTAGVDTRSQQGRQGSSSVAMATVDEASHDVFPIFVVFVSSIFALIFSLYPPIQLAPVADCLIKQISKQ